VHYLAFKRVPKIRPEDGPAAGRATHLRGVERLGPNVLMT